ncbi:chaperone HtpG [Marssonina coronariae]|uniref:Chaperone HtpG n=1 Tax=Diplocarpon coronariae TaxID=2795749 RepID=A0A218YRH8_9HELO|nr:chaperone HtpG [Marssonina coronariae]
MRWQEGRLRAAERLGAGRGALPRGDWRGTWNVEHRTSHIEEPASWVPPRASAAADPGDPGDPDPVRRASLGRGGASASPSAVSWAWSPARLLGRSRGTSGADGRAGEDPGGSKMSQRCRVQENRGRLRAPRDVGSHHQTRSIIVRIIIVRIIIAESSSQDHHRQNHHHHINNHHK